MRILTSHIVAGDSANHQLTIEVTDQPGAGGANHRYEINGFDATHNPSNDIEEDVTGPRCCTILFQNGPIKEVGVNGVTQEALIAICIDRLNSFQAGPFACKANQDAQQHLVDALYLLQQRTRERIARGVEGTHAK